MNRENIKNIGLILALIIAGISIPISIISFGNKTTIINNYYYEQNYYGKNESF